MDGRPHRVLIIVENLPVPFDRRVWMEATTLRANGYEVSVICPIGGGFQAEYEVIDGVHVYRHPLPPEVSSVGGYLREYGAALYHEAKLVRRVHRERGIDIIHLCNPPDLLFLIATPLKLLRGVRVVFDQHDLNPEMYIAKYDRRDIFYVGLRIAERLTYALADRVITTNESYREVATSRGGQRPEHVTVVRSGPDLARFHSVRPDSRYRRGRRFLVGYVGVMGEQDGIEYLLRAIAHIVHDRQRADIQFMLVGGGPAVQGLRTMCRDMGLDDFVEFAGRVPDVELIERLSTTDVCVDPGPKTPVNDKSTMNKTLEYMALGRPIVQFDLTEARRSAGGASLYARPNDTRDFGDKILELLQDPERCQRMGRVGQERMRSALSWEYQAPKLLRVYESLTADGLSART